MYIQDVNCNVVNNFFPFLYPILLNSSISEYNFYSTNKKIIIINL